MTRTEFCGSPSSVRHELWTYSLILCEAPRAQPNQGILRTANAKTLSTTILRATFAVDKTIKYSRVSTSLQPENNSKRADSVAKRARLAPTDSWYQVAYNLTNSEEISSYCLCSHAISGDEGLFVSTGATASTASYHPDSPHSAV